MILIMKSIDEYCVAVTLCLVIVFVVWQTTPALRDLWIDGPTHGAPGYSFGVS